MNIVNVGYNATNYYILGESSNRLLVDVGWPETLPMFLASIKKKGINLREIVYMLPTHYHRDHSGLVLELKKMGIRLLALEQQIQAMKPISDFEQAQGWEGGKPPKDIILLTSQNSRNFLKSIGFAGQIIHTPGHSDDSVSLVLDDGSAFTGDLGRPEWARPSASAAINKSWAAILALNAKTVYPGHGPVRPIQGLFEGV